MYRCRTQQKFLNVPSVFRLYFLALAFIFGMFILVLINYWLENIECLIHSLFLFYSCVWACTSDFMASAFLLLHKSTHSCVFLVSVPLSDLKTLFLSQYPM